MRIEFPKEKFEVICPECGSKMILRTTSKFTYPNGDPRKFWGCSRFPECKNVHGAHPDGMPFGRPGTLKDKAARIRAHGVFDRFREDTRRSKASAYKWLAYKMSSDKLEAHFGQMNESECNLAVKLMEKEMEKTSAQPVTS